MSEATMVLAEILGAGVPERIPLNWGKYEGSRAAFRKGILIGFPHLSRFGIMTRPASASALARLLRPVID